MMRISLKSSALRRTNWREYAMRFIFGGLITVAAGLIAHQFGPVVGGLFLAFPAIFPASVTLVEKHETDKKEKEGIDGERRARSISAIVAAGTSLASLGLFAFAVIVWQLSPRIAAWQVLVLAMLTWLVVATLA